MSFFNHNLYCEDGGSKCRFAAVHQTEAASNDVLFYGYSKKIDKMSKNGGEFFGGVTSSTDTTQRSAETAVTASVARDTSRNFVD